LGQAMDLNCLTWIVSLGVAEQVRMRSSGVVTLPLVSMQPSGTLEATAGGDKVVIGDSMAVVAQDEQTLTAPIDTK
jgi:hypothetical protein